MSIAFFSCSSGQSPIEETQVELFYQRAIKALDQSDPSSTLELLRKSHVEGEIQPMQIVLDAKFHSLIDDPVTRPKIRGLIKKLSKLHQSQMTRSEEPGICIEVIGQIVDEDGLQPLSDVSIELVHTDEKGLYFGEKSM